MGRSRTTAGQRTPKRGLRAVVAGLMVAVLAVVLVACGSSSNSTSSSSASSAGASVSNASGPPNVVNASWGTFKLKASIAAKVKAGEPINYLNSFEASGTPSFGAQWTAGYKYGCEQGKKIYALNCELVAPVKSNINEQIAQVQAKIAAGQVDCLSIQPPTETAINALVNETIAKGIPVFTVGEEDHAHQLMNFTQHHESEGEVAAETVIKWMNENHKHFTVFTMSSGLPTLGWAQGRMRGFKKGILKQIPSAKFLNSESNAEEVPLEPGPGYDAAKSYISAHPEVQVFMNTDINGEAINKAISDTGNKGKIYSIAWNPSKGQLKGIEEGLQIATIDQRWFDQAAYGASACATFLKTGKILPNTQKPNPITLAQVPAERTALNKIEASEG